MTNKQAILEQISQLVNKGEAKKALAEIKKFDRKYPQDVGMQIYKPHFFIDAGCDLKDSLLIKQGITIGEKNLLLHPNEEICAHTHYNIANGYMTLFDLTERSEVCRVFLESDNLQKAKEHLREAIVLTDSSQGDLRKQIFVNYGNCLDTLGRCVEALNSYKEATRIDKNFSMAIGNEAITLCRFAEISGEYGEAIYIEAYKLLKKAMRSSELESYGGSDVIKSFKQKAEVISSAFKDPTVLESPLNHPKYDKQKLSPVQNKFVEFSIKNSLFLNFHIHKDTCETAIYDPIFIQMFTPIDKDQVFYEMASYINQIKEDFATARYLLFQAMETDENTSWISRRTVFAYARDHSQFNLYNGILKSAFEEAYSILDKIAVTIMRYSNVNFSIKNISFRNIWETDGEFREEFIKTENFNLYALYDINRDFETSPEFKILREIRNASTHRKLIIFNSFTPIKNRTLHEIDYDQMVKETIRLLKLVKAAIIYLILYINNEEKKKHDKNAMVIPMYISTNQFR